MKFLAFGEILWDIFGDTRTLGGAPLNVAGHMARLGATSSIISNVGCDELGRQTLKTLGSIGVCDTYIGRNCNLDTGIANIQLEKGIPSYEFNDPCAWDAITLSDELKARLKEGQPDVFCFGILAQRNNEP